MKIFGLIFCLCLTGCNVHRTDETTKKDSILSREIVGTWSVDFENKVVWSLESFGQDGSYSIVGANIDTNWDYKGTWHVKDGVLILSTVKGPGPDDEQGTFQHKIIQITQTNLIYELLNGYPSNQIVSLFRD